jgi:hypothetical protein
VSEHLFRIGGIFRPAVLVLW